MAQTAAIVYLRASRLREVVEEDRLAKVGLLAAAGVAARLQVGAAHHHRDREMQAVAVAVALRTMVRAAVEVLMQLALLAPAQQEAMVVQAPLHQLLELLLPTQAVAVAELLQVVLPDQVVQAVVVAAV
jgi:hypothetical protein